MCTTRVISACTCKIYSATSRFNILHPFTPVTFNSWETVCTTSLWLSLKCYAIGPLVMIGSLNQVSPVVTTCLECYRWVLLAGAHIPTKMFLFTPIATLHCFVYWQISVMIWVLQGTRSALYANGRESITVTVQEVTPRSVGALVALYERAVGIYASLVNVNAYHQPGKKIIQITFYMVLRPLNFSSSRNMLAWFPITSELLELHREI